MEVRHYLPKYGIIFLFLVAFTFMFVIYSMDILEFQRKDNSTIITPHVSTDPYMHHGICTFQPQSPEDALEEHLLLESIAWPETPALPDPILLEQTSDPVHSKFTILPRRGGGQWHVGDQLEVMIQMCDFRGRAKRSGGDFLIARLHNKALGAGVAGEVVDHLNGSYSTVFSLLWNGSAEVEVTLVHPSEAIMVLHRLNREHPDRVYFKSVFQSGSVSETTTCNLCLRPAQQLLCNYTDPHTGEPWFCFKPKNLSCNTRINHFMGGAIKNLTAKEEKLFQSGVNMKVSIRASGPAAVTVLPNKTGQPEMNNNHVMLQPSGYYYQGVWRALGDTTVRQFNTPSAVSQCLKGKMVHLYGDSTVRQWFEHFTATLPDLKQFNLHSMKQSGPFMALDFANNIMMTFRCHGTPVRIFKVQTSQVRYIANEIDGLAGGTNTVVVFGIWAHFGTFPIEIYIRRLQGIRKAVVWLLDRAPGTLVIIRTANLKALNLDVALTNSDWYSLQTDKVLRAMFKGLNVHLVDAWQMSLAHHLPHDLHPQAPIIKNMINVLLSYICPQKGG